MTYLSKLSSAQQDRAIGVLLGTAAGDALGAGYEFGPPLPDATPVHMNGGGGFGWAPGEWTDDTSMAMPLAEAVARGDDLREEKVQDGIAGAWAKWARTSKDVGIQTSQVIRGAGTPSAATFRNAARAVHERAGKSGGNGSLMRTAPLALAYLDDPEALDDAARAVSALTHYDPEAGEACALWCLAIRHAVLHGTFDGLRAAVEALPEDRCAVWTARLDEAEASPPSSFTKNGWVVQALQGAWSAITRTPVPNDDSARDSFPSAHLRLALEAAVRGGKDTDTVAAIAGGLLGARWGATAVPTSWRRILHGWPGYRSRDLVRLAMQAVNPPTRSSSSWPLVARVDYSGYADTRPLVRHPFDEGVWLGGVGRVAEPPEGVDAVVSLCRVGSEEMLAETMNHVEIALIDNPDPAKNPNLDAVLADAADTVAAFRAEGRTVLLHCVQAQSRTPTVAALYAMRHLGIPAERALSGVLTALPAARPNRAFLAALERFAGRPVQG